MFKRSISFALLVLAAAAHADTLYSNIDAGGVFTTSPFASVGDDFQFGTLGSTYNPVVTINQIQFGYRTIAATSFDAVVSFYQDIDITTPTNSTSTASILTSKVGGVDAYTPIKSYRFSFTATGAGFTPTGIIDLTNYGGAFTLPAISDFNLRNHGVQIAFYNPGTTVQNTNVRALFTGAQDPTVGYSYNTYGRDANADGVIVPSERANFGDPQGARANLFLQLNGTAAPVPEPGTWAALGLGAVAVLRRRKRA